MLLSKSPRYIRFVDVFQVIKLLEKLICSFIQEIYSPNQIQCLIDRKNEGTNEALSHRVLIFFYWINK